MITASWDAPVGTAAERAGPLCSGRWRIALGYGIYYLLEGKYPAIHTGIDLVLKTGNCYGEPLYAPADGVVTFARDVVGTTWRQLIVIRHTLPDGSVICTRYGHCSAMIVKAGDTVQRGAPIGNIGNAVVFSPHLHFDVVPGTLLINDPTNWPGDNLPFVRQHYLDPLLFGKEHHLTTTLDYLNAMKTQLAGLAANIDAAIATESEPIPEPPPDPVPTAVQAWVTAVPTLRVRASASTSAAIVGQLATNAAIMVVDAGTADGLVWCKITEGTYKDKFVAKNYLRFQ